MSTIRRYYYYTPNSFSVEEYVSVMSFPAAAAALPTMALSEGLESTNSAQRVSVICFGLFVVIGKQCSLRMRDFLLSLILIRLIPPAS